MSLAESPTDVSHIGGPAAEQRLTAEDLLFGTSTLHEVVIPRELLRVNPGSEALVDDGNNRERKTIQLQPLSLKTFQKIIKAGEYDSDQIPRQIIREGVLNPALDDEQIAELPVGLANFLVEKIQWISGLSEKKTL